MNCMRLYLNQLNCANTLTTLSLRFFFSFRNFKILNCFESENFFAEVSQWVINKQQVIKRQIFVPITVKWINLDRMVNMIKPSNHWIKVSLIQFKFRIWRNSLNHYHTKKKQEIFAVLGRRLLGSLYHSMPIGFPKPSSNRRNTTKSNLISIFIFHPQF